MTDIEAEVLAAAYTYCAALLALSFNPSSGDVRDEFYCAKAKLLNKAARLQPMATWVKAADRFGPHEPQ